MGLRPEFENVRSSIQHRVPPPDIERAVADVRSEETRLSPLYQVLAAEHASGASKKKNMTGDSSLLSSLRSPPKFLIV